MFKKLFILFTIILAAAAAASWLASQPGAVQIEWLGWRMELPTSLAVALIIIFALILVFFDRLLRACQMCAGALYWAQISKIVYGATEEKRGFKVMNTTLHPKTEVVGGVLENECSTLLKKFFIQKRNLN